RRHTSSKRDWSADVWSSDLIGRVRGVGRGGRLVGLGHVAEDLLVSTDRLDPPIAVPVRSEPCPRGPTRSPTASIRPAPTGSGKRSGGRRAGTEGTGRWARGG